MCGIAGKILTKPGRPPSEDEMRRMLAMIRHRGPDQFGILLDDVAALGNARLSIIDLAGGQQPIANEDDSLWIVFNGEIFNYVELRAELVTRGHRFRTHSDTEVILHLYEEKGPDCLKDLNGQFAIAIWDRRNRELFLGRDRLGVRPVFYTNTGNSLLFASEIKSLLALSEVRREIDPMVVDQVFSYWCPISPRTAFRDVFELPPAHYLLVRGGELKISRYWQLEFPSQHSNTELPPTRSSEDIAGEFRDLLIDAVKIRLRSDVPVGAYLSGGLDSSTIAAIIRRFAANRLDTFSIAFTDQEFDESEHQLRMARFLGTDHHVVKATHADIGRQFPDVIWHTEVPIMRTSPAPMFLLSRLVKDNNFKVVLTGEGADEFLGGYDIFKEAKVREFWARQPSSAWRHRLLGKLYPDITGLHQGAGAYLTAFFRGDLKSVQDPFYSHAIRWRNNQRTRRYLSEDVMAMTKTQGHSAATLVERPAEFDRWGLLERAQFTEISLFMSQYLLSSQGDRVAMAHSVEGRFPFLDKRVVEYASGLPQRLKLRGLTEKVLLRKVAKEWLPPEITQRTKRPYRAPIHRSFFHTGAPEYVRELLSPAHLAGTGLFKAGAVQQLISRLDEGKPIGETDDMALAGLLSTQLLHHLFIDRAFVSESLGQRDDVKVCRLGSWPGG